jgi:hypothetical protein
MLSAHRLKALKAEREAFEKAEREKAELPAKQAVARLAKTHGELLAAQRQLDAMELLNGENNSKLASRVPVYQPNEDSVEVIREKIRAAYESAKRALTQRGYELLPTFDETVKKILALNRSLDFTAADNMTAIIGYALEVGALIEGQHVVAPAPEPEPTPEPVIDKLAALESQETVTREGAKKARRMAEDLAVDAQRPMFHEFIGHMRDVWNHPMSQADQERCVDFIVKFDLPWNAKTYNIVRQQVLGCRLLDEQLSIAIETTERPLSDYAVRQDFAQRRREIEGTV